MWFAEASGDLIGKITPAGVITEYPAGSVPGSSPWGIAAGPDGNIWFTEVYSHKIGKLDPDTGDVTHYSDGITDNTEELRPRTSSPPDRTATCGSPRPVVPARSGRSPPAVW